LPTFHALVGIEIIHKIQVGPNELNLIDGPKHWLNISIYDPSEQEFEESGGVAKQITRIQKYSAGLTSGEYEALVEELKESGVLSLPINTTPEFHCNDGMTIHFDMTIDTINRLEGRHVCDDGFDAIQNAAEIIFKFAEVRVADVNSVIAEIRRYY